jgi:DNA invertase Pin-like site-specific DNA recombinase
MLAPCFASLKKENDMAKHEDRRVGIYVRLSNEDSRLGGESVSIENQKLMLCKHVHDKGWELKDTYVDDGFSGTNQNRPAFKRMLEDVQAGFINTILIKDLSRLGRNYLEVGNLAEVFLPEHDCELISLNEPMDDMIFLRNWFNEQHSKTTSEKVRAAKRISALSGRAQSGYVPFGYKKNPDKPCHYIIDEEAAPTVRRIFDMKAQGYGFKAIAILLNDEGVPSPRAHYNNRHKPDAPETQNFFWGQHTVRKIIQNEVYIGNLVQGKLTTTSYKNRKIIAKSPDTWVRVDNTHDPIVTRDTWDAIQRSMKERNKSRGSKSEGKCYLFSGMLCCASCGYSFVSKSTKRGNGGHSTYYICGKYQHCGKNACGCNTIRETLLVKEVLGNLRTLATIAHSNGNRLLDLLATEQDKSISSTRKSFLGELSKRKNAVKKIDDLVTQMYEDRLKGLVPDALLQKQTTKLERERLEHEDVIRELELRLREIRNDMDSIEKFANLVANLRGISSLDVETLRSVIDKIVVDEAPKKESDKTRGIEIHYNYVGVIDLEKLN